MPPPFVCCQVSLKHRAAVFGLELCLNLYSSWFWNFFTDGWSLPHLFEHKIIFERNSGSLRTDAVMKPIHEHVFPAQSILFVGWPRKGMFKQCHT
jgi:hypothetical protein